MTTHQPPTSLNRPRRPRRLGLLAPLGVLALVIAACGDAAGSEGALTVDIVAPRDGARVGTAVEVGVDASVEIGEPDTGRHHLHLYVDGNTTEGEYAIVYDDGGHTITGLAPGEHTIEARIVNADHSPTEASEEITVTVVEGGGVSDEPVPATSDDPASGY